MTRLLLFAQYFIFKSVKKLQCFNNSYRFRLFIAQAKIVHVKNQLSRKNFIVKDIFKAKTSQNWVTFVFCRSDLFLSMASVECRRKPYFKTTVVLFELGLWTCFRISLQVRVHNKIKIRFRVGIKVSVTVKIYISHMRLTRIPKLCGYV